MAKARPDHQALAIRSSRVEEDMPVAEGTTSAETNQGVVPAEVWVLEESNSKWTEQAGSECDKIAGQIENLSRNSESDGKTMGVLVRVFLQKSELSDQSEVWDIGLQQDQSVIRLPCESYETAKEIAGEIQRWVSETLELVGEVEEL
jgi:hypothetical protein